MVSVAKGRHGQNAAVELTTHTTKPKAKECGATSLMSSLQKPSASLVHKGGSSLTRHNGWRRASLARAEAREEYSNVNPLVLTSTLIDEYWWKGSPVLDGRELGNGIVVLFLSLLFAWPHRGNAPRPRSVPCSTVISSGVSLVHFVLLVSTACLPESTYARVCASFEMLVIMLM